MNVAGAVTIVFSVVTVTVGVWRHLETTGSPEALWFGGVMAAVALTGGMLLLRGRRRAGLAVAAFALVVVSGWFIRRVVIGHEEGMSLRMVIILTACAIEAAAIVWVLMQRTPE